MYVTPCSLSTAVSWILWPCSPTSLRSVVHPNRLLSTHPLLISRHNAGTISSTHANFACSNSSPTPHALSTLHLFDGMYRSHLDTLTFTTQDLWTTLPVCMSLYLCLVCLGDAVAVQMSAFMPCLCNFVLQSDALQPRLFYGIYGLHPDMRISAMRDLRTDDV